MKNTINNNLLTIVDTTEIIWHNICVAPSTPSKKWKKRGTTQAWRATGWCFLVVSCIQNSEVRGCQRSTSLEWPNNHGWCVHCTALLHCLLCTTPPSVTTMRRASAEDTENSDSRGDSLSFSRALEKYNMSMTSMSQMPLTHAMHTLSLLCLSLTCTFVVNRRIFIPWSVQPGSTVNIVLYRRSETLPRTLPFRAFLQLFLAIIMLK